MAQNYICKYNYIYKIRNALKNLLFYTSEIKKSKKKNKNFTNNRFSSNYHFFLKKIKI